MRGEFQPRQFIFGDDHARLPPLRPRQGDELTGPPTSGPRTVASQFTSSASSASLKRPAGRIRIKRRAGAMRHAPNDFCPAVLVIMIAENLLIGMAEIAVGRQQLFFLARSGKAQQPFRAGHLGGDVAGWRQQLHFRNARQRDVIELPARR